MLSDVKLNDFKRQWQVTSANTHQAVERVGSSGWWILGQEVQKFEAALASTAQMAHAVGVANGLDAIEIGLRASSLPPGSDVLTTPLSAFATALGIVRAGHRPLFCDVDESGLIDLDRAAELCSTHPNVKGIVPVHLFGHSVDLRKLEALRDRFSLVVVEDAAQALGAFSDGLPIGSVGCAVATSFYPTKNLGAMGDGGALLTNDGSIEKNARTLRDYGQSTKYVHDVPGLNSRLDELHAAILLDAHLPFFGDWTNKRRQIAARYQEAIRNELVSVVPTPKYSHSVFHLFPVLVRESQFRSNFMEHLAMRKIQSGVHYPRLLPHQQAIGQAVVYGGLPVAERFAECEVSLPIHPFLHDDEIERVISAVNEWRPS